MLLGFSPGLHGPIAYKQIPQLNQQSGGAWQVPEQGLLWLLWPVCVQEPEMCSLMNYTPEERPELQLPHLIQLADKVTR